MFRTGRRGILGPRPRTTEVVAVPEANAQLVHQEFGVSSGHVDLVDMAGTSAVSAKRSGPAARPQRCKRRSGTRRSSTWPSAPASLPFSALTTARGFPDRSLPIRYARIRPSSRTARPQPASATWDRRTFRRDVTGLCPARPCTPRRWATLTTCARFAASSPAEPHVPGSHRPVPPTWCSPSASPPPTPCATRTAAEHYGLWLVNQVCDLVQARTGRAGTTIRLHMRLKRHSPRRHVSRQTH
jgi:hypothetical protein